MSNKKFEIMKELQQMLTNGPLENLRAQMVEFLRRAKTEENQVKILIDLVNYVSSFQDENLTRMVRVINLLKNQSSKKNICDMMETVRNKVAVLGRDSRKREDQFHFVYNHNDRDFYEDNIFIKASEMTIPEDIKSTLNDKEIIEVKEFIKQQAGEILEVVCNLRIAVNGK